MGLGGLSQRSHRSRPIIHYNPPPQHSWPDRGNAEAFYEFFAYVWQICIFCVYAWQICIFEASITGIQALGWAPFNSSYFSSVNWFRETILNTALFGLGTFLSQEGRIFHHCSRFGRSTDPRFGSTGVGGGDIKGSFSPFRYQSGGEGPYLCTGLAS